MLKEQVSVFVPSLRSNSQGTSHRVRDPPNVPDQIIVPFPLRSETDRSPDKNVSENIMCM